MKTVSILSMGFGHVGQAFARLLLRKQAELREKHQLDLRIVGIATGRHGRAICPEGIPLNEALAIIDAGGDLTALSKHEAPADNLAFIRACQADALLEISPVNYATGQPALSHLQTALRQKMHAITANKGPLVHGYAQLRALAAENQVRFLFESTVMDGAPVFALWKNAMQGANLIGFHGILNSCTNLLIERMESGETLDQAVAYGKSIGITETDPSGDIDGWDAAIKVAALITVLMDIPFTPQQVNREGIRSLTPKLIAEAQKSRRRWKLVCRASRLNDEVEASVRLEQVSQQSALFGVSGTSSYVQFKTDTLPGLGMLEGDPGPDTTAYGLLADLLRAYQV
ncbi:MAG: homoserine dehydrogenase [Anaerolineaceae bacterium]|nr:homoserine dehydrogenase [Anaerolineaceae bacterium]